MRNITETTGFVAGFTTLLQQFPIAEGGTVACGRSGMPAVFGVSIHADLGLGNGGNVEADSGRERSRVDLTTERMLTADGSGVSGHELALARGKRLVEHIEATPRYGASGECPRKIPA